VAQHLNYFTKFRCQVVDRFVEIEIHEVELFAQGGLADAARMMRGCSGAAECGIFPREPVKKPTGCPYFDLFCSG
jgi:hypothetical protein